MERDSASSLSLILPTRTMKESMNDCEAPRAWSERCTSSPGASMRTNAPSLLVCMNVVRTSISLSICVGARGEREHGQQAPRAREDATPLRGCPRAARVAASAPKPRGCLRARRVSPRARARAEGAGSRSRQLQQCPSGTHVTGSPSRSPGPPRGRPSASRWASETSATWTLGGFGTRLRAGPAQGAAQRPQRDEAQG